MAVSHNMIQSDRSTGQGQVGGWEGQHVAERKPSQHLWKAHGFCVYLELG